jgi:RNase P subunit RPR2
MSCECETAFKVIYILNKIDENIMNEVNIMCKSCGSIIRKGEKGEKW